MHRPIIALAALACAFAVGRLSAQDVEPLCTMCAAEYMPAEEVTEYAFVTRSYGPTDVPFRAVDVGGANVQLAVVHRGRQSNPRGTVGEHDLVTEVYYILSGGGTVRTGSDLVNPVRRAADSRSVTTTSGPGNNAEDIRNPDFNTMKQGDILVIPPGTGHHFVEIPDHVTYLIVRFDPEQVLPLVDAAASRAFLDGQGAR